jgi:signal transduction histidine kinase
MDQAPGTTIPPLSLEQLAQVNRLSTVARFIAGLAHELNNSLQIISGLVELLAERDDLPPDVLVRIGRIGTQADRATGKIKQVVGYIREPAREGERVDLGGIVDRALTLRSYELERAGITVLWDVPLERFVVRGSARDLHQAILNLLANAHEALAGASTRELHVVLARGAGTVQLSIGDTGPGVAMPVRDRIFDPFFTTRGAEGAMGLGLTVAAQTAAVHGGALWLEDHGPGATFVLDLPDDDGR